MSSFAPPCHLAAQTGKDACRLVSGDRRAQDVLHPRSAQAEHRLGPRRRAHVDGARGHRPPAQLHEQLAGHVERRRDHLGVETLLVAGRRLAAQAQRAGGAHDGRPGEVGALQEDVGGLVGDLAVQAAHDAGDHRGPLGVGDDQHVVGRGTRSLVVERGDLLARIRPPHDDASARAWSAGRRRAAADPGPTARSWSRPPRC